MEFRNREIIENNFVFCLWKNPKIYSKFSKKIDELSFFFKEESSSFYYSIGKKMVDSGITSFDQATVLSYIGSNTIIKDKFNQLGGYDTFRVITNSLDSSNADGFFNEIIKMNVINDLENKGINVEKYYDKISLMSVEEIRAFFSYQLNETFIKTGSETRIEDFSITEDDYELFNSGKQMGLSIAKTSPLLNYEILGLNRGLTFIGGHVNQGKAQPLDSIVVTPFGYKRIGDLKINDTIIGYKLNNSTSYSVQKVKGIYPQGKKRVYEVIFEDGSYTKCCIDHLWTFINKNGEYVTETLQWFVDHMNDNKANVYYMLPRKVYNPSRKVRLRPSHHLYSIGYIAGDRCNIDTGIVEFNSAEHYTDFYNSMLNNIENIEFATMNDGAIYNRLYKIKFDKTIIDWMSGKGKGKLQKMDIFINPNSGKEYKAFNKELIYSLDYQDKLDLLNGWLASSAQKADTTMAFKVSTKNVPMLDFMEELARSIGWTVWRTSPKVAYFEQSSPKKIKLKAVIDAGYEDEMVCIKVSGPNELYITDNFIPTHNTSYSFAVVVKAWLQAGIKCCIISNEQTINEFKQLMIAMVSYELFGEDGLDRRRLKVGRFTNQEEQKFKQIAEVINRDYVPYIKFAKIFNYSIEDVQMIIETLSAQGYGGFIYDVFKADDSTSNKVIGEMKEMAKELFMCADRTDSSIIATVQLGLSDLGVRYLTLENISTSKHITEPATEVLLIRQMWDDEITGAKHDIKIETPTFDNHGNVLKDKKGKPIMKPIIVSEDDYRKIKIVFIAKTRNTGNGIAIAYRFNGGFNQWEELGYCYPSHENRGKK